MNMLETIKNKLYFLFYLPELKNYQITDFDKEDAAALEREIYAKKKVLHLLYHEYCRPFIESANRAPDNAVMLEIGSRTSPLKRYIPKLITSDVIDLKWLDMTCSAYSIPFDNSSLDRIFLMFVCHHLSKFENFLSEAARCLKDGGELIIVDPAITIFSRLYYKIHVDKMDITTTQWGFDGSGIITDSNIALAWIVFFRDKARFNAMYPEFVVEKIEYNTCLSFLLSGGFRFRQMLPTSVIKTIFKLENFIIKHVTQQLSVVMALTIKKLPMLKSI